MIDIIEVINFQSHQHAILDLHPGVNVIKGTSHHGKSSIIRAMKWLLFNQPRGAGFKSHFASMRDPVEVGTIFSDNSWVSRVRDNENRYVSDDFSLKALKTDVPDEVQAITHINYVNFQSQADPYFLIGDTPGQAGKKLNELVGLEIIDEVRKKVTQKINLLGVELKLADKNLNETLESLENLEHIDEAENLVNEIESFQSKNIELWRRQSKIHETVELIKANQKLLVDLLTWLEVEEDYFFVLSQYHELGEKQTKATSLGSIVEQIAFEQNIKNEAEIVINLESELKNIKSVTKRLAEKRFKHDKIQKAYSGIHKLKSTILNCEKTLIRASERRTELEAQLQYCQYCGSDRKYWRK